MSVSGLNCNSSRCFLRSTTLARGLRSPCDRISLITHSSSSFIKNTEPLRLNSGNYWISNPWEPKVKRNYKIKSGMDTSFSGDMNFESGANVFPRINIKDPYKRLGISKEASEEEIQAARNFLINRYAGHKPSVDAIESAHDKIIMQTFHERRRPKLNIKKKVRDVTQSRVVQAVTSRFQTPSTNYIIKTASVFVILGVLTVLYPTEEGPTLQVAISLLATIYFIYDRLKSRMRAFLYGAGAFAVSWLLGTFLMVSVIPPVLRGPRSLEVTTSLLSYVLLWVSSAYLI
ncbi:hypothetical protein C5167_007748 [Papaver somniferum]|uniref:protein CHAPERONE-LIKE PROTEIN OF POR1, chloroplastic-like n=1 Tax=Papaver somniferum TaxID=3469 RepID=UPI000E6FFFB5|nr:protein CHAPERONE-LIKE PROTEIN OF POR1, chloroplastic-like [Papaver somniferum]RZC85136.1 hypothetical protein C5167_007748 [Papaver somniferum]